jgi:hypothetical protein
VAGDLALQPPDQVLRGHGGEGRADADADVVGAREEPEIASEPGREAHEHGGVAARVPARGHGEPGRRRRLQERPPHEAPRSVGAHHEVEPLISSRRRAQPSRRVDLDHALADVKRPGLHRLAEDPRVDVAAGADRDGRRERHVDALSVARLEDARAHPADRQGIGRRRRRQQVEGLGSEPAPARLLSRMRGVEDDGRRPVRGEAPGEERPRGARADDGDPHAPFPAAARTSSGVAEAVPSLPTTTPAA